MLSAQPAVVAKRRRQQAGRDNLRPRQRFKLSYFGLRIINPFR
jgi:hypothetical protein